MMKAQKLSILLVMVVFLSGCVVYSFYPLYTEKDLFPNELLTGEWLDDDGSEWIFVHPMKGKNEPGIRDSTRYELHLKTVENEKSRESEFTVHVIELGGHYFLDFYFEEFAKLTVRKNKLVINWFDQEWLQDLIKENKIRIHHENNNEFILLTAKPRELQKFVTKYVNSEEAFKNGLEAELTRK